LPATNELDVEKDESAGRRATKRHGVDRRLDFMDRLAKYEPWLSLRLTKKTFVARASCKWASSPGSPLVVRAEIYKKADLLDCDVPEQTLRGDSRLGIERRLALATAAKRGQK
jgi:hypothetical protein